MIFTTSTFFGSCCGCISEGGRGYGAPLMPPAPGRAAAAQSTNPDEMQPLPGEGPQGKDEEGQGRVGAMLGAGLGAGKTSTTKQGGVHLAPHMIPSYTVTPVCIQLNVQLPAESNKFFFPDSNDLPGISKSQPEEPTYFPPHRWLSVEDVNLESKLFVNGKDGTQSALGDLCVLLDQHGSTEISHGVYRTPASVTPWFLSDPACTRHDPGVVDEKDRHVGAKGNSDEKSLQATSNNADDLSPDHALTNIELLGLRSLQAFDKRAITPGAGDMTIYRAGPSAAPIAPESNVGTSASTAAHVASHIHHVLATSGCTSSQFIMGGLATRRQPNNQTAVWAMAPAQRDAHMNMRAQDEVSM